MVDISVVILAYKSKKHLSVLLPSLWSSEDVVFSKTAQSKKYFGEVIVVDNGSGDGTYEWLNAEFRDLKEQGFFVTAIRNGNTGFASGNNIGINQAKGRYILLLNPDTEVFPNTLSIMIELMERRPEIGISGCKLLKADGSLDLACRRRFPNPWSGFARLFLKNTSNYNYSNLPEDMEMEVDSVVGAFMLIRRELFSHIGLLDEDFFMYGEDLDYCWRAKFAGYKVWYCPKAQALHYKGESSKKIPFLALRWFHDSMWIFYRKHYKTRYPFFLNWFVWLGIYGRLAFLTFINMFKAEPRVSK